jgi:SAM-dependent methyltransferase
LAQFEIGGPSRFAAGGSAVSEYRPADYWSRRLSREFNLKGTGHVQYSEAYNVWLYRAKRRALGRAMRHAGRPSAALDVGSGVGWVVGELLRRGLEVEGCDIAPVAVDGLRARFPGLTFFQLAVGDEPIPRPGASYDLVTALDVTYHITDDARWRSGVAEMGRVLRPGGSLIVIDGLGAREVSPAEHVRFRPLDAWIEAGRRAGLEMHAVIPCYRWISRDRAAGPFSRLPDGARGAVEYSLEWLAPRPPHMRCAVLRRPRSVRTA